MFFQMREVPGLKKKPATSELLDWLKLLMVEDMPAEALRTQRDAVVIPPLHGALLKNEQDVHLFERLAFLARRGRRGLDVRALHPGAARRPALPASITEYLTLLAAMKADVARIQRRGFLLSLPRGAGEGRAASGPFRPRVRRVFKGLEPPEGDLRRDLPEEWLRKLAEKLLTPEEMAADRGAGRASRS